MATAEAQAQMALLQSLWLTALDEPIGLLVRTSNPEALRAALYRARAKLAIPHLEALQVRMSPFPDGQLVICHPPQAGGQ